MVEAKVPTDRNRPLRATDPSRLRLATADQQQEIATRLKSLTTSGLPDASVALLHAAVTSQAGFFNEAAEALQAAMDEPQATVAIRLADLYLGLGQWRAADNTYRWAEQLLPTHDDANRAALYLGRGRLSARRDNDGYVASQDLEKAADLFQKLGLTGLAEVARAEAKQALSSNP